MSDIPIRREKWPFNPPPPYPPLKQVKRLKPEKGLKPLKGHLFTFSEYPEYRISGPGFGPAAAAGKTVIGYTYLTPPRWR